MSEDLSKERLRILGEIGNLTKQINTFNQQGNRDSETSNSLNKERLRLAKELKNINETIRKSQRTYYIDAQTALKSLNTLYTPIKNAEKDRLGLMLKQGDITSVAIERGNTLAEINRNIAQLTSDQKFERELLQEQFDIELKKFKYQKNISKEIVDNLQYQNALATEYSSLTESQKEYLEQQISVYDGIQKSIRGVLDTASLLTRGPAGIFGSVAIGAGFLWDKMAGIRKELGGIAPLSTTVLSFLDDSAVENAKELASQFGGMNNVTMGMQVSTSMISKNMGISGKEASDLLGTLSRMNGNSTDIAKDLMVSTREFAKQNGIIPSQLMSDLASNTEAFALYGKDGGKNLIKAAGYARKLGVEFGKITGLADNLLDFESSITKELELGAMLGKNINLDRARGLAFAGDLEGATKETLNALGGVDAFNKMDIFSKKASAELLGVSVDELQKMVNNQKEANSLGGDLNSKFSYLSEASTYIANEWGGGILKSLGGGLIMIGQMGTGLKQISDISTAIKNTKLVQWAGEKISLGWQKLKGIFAKKELAIAQQTALVESKKSLSGGKSPILNSTKTLTDSVNPTKKGGVADSVSKMNMNSVLKGAAALVIVAGAVFIFGKAVQEFMKVSWESVGMAVVSMLSLVGAVSLLGLLMSSGVGTVAILAGAAAMVIMASSVLILGYALQSIGTGFEMLGNGLTTLVPNLTGIGGAIASLVMYIPAISTLSFSLLGLSISLAAVGVAGVLASPALMILSTILPSLGSNLIGMGEGISSMISLLPTIPLLALSLLGLSTSLVAIGIAGVMASPFLMVLSSVLPLLGSNLMELSNGISSMGSLLPILPTLTLSLLGLSTSLVAIGIAGVMASPFLMALSSILPSLGSNLIGIGEGISSMGSLLPIIPTLALSLLGLSTSLVAIGMAGSVTLPFLMVLSSVLPVLNSNLMGIGETLSSLITYIPAISALSLSLMGLSSSLLAVGAAGLLATPGLLALSTVGAISTELGSMLGLGEGNNSEDNTMKMVLDEIKGLRDDLKSGKIGVYMDGTAVTSKISKVVDRIGYNSYS